MEPIIGTWSFVLLAPTHKEEMAAVYQIDAKPFNERILRRSRTNLYKQFPEYDYEREIVRDYRVGPVRDPEDQYGSRRSMWACQPNRCCHAPGSSAPRRGIWSR